jgi:hypothetical protein
MPTFRFVRLLLCSVWFAAVLYVLVCATSPAIAQVSTTASSRASRIRYPLKASRNGHYLVDQDNVPMLMIGDAPQDAFALLSESQWNTYLADRQSHGVNALWVDALCGQYLSIKGNGTVGCNDSMRTYDGIAPFRTGNDQTSYDVSTPNDAYWSRVKNYIDTAGRYGMTILLNVWDTAGLKQLMQSSGDMKMYNFGVFLGNRYKAVPNIIWMVGNDFGTWNTNATHNNLMKNLMAGIASVDKVHLMTTQLDGTSQSLDDQLLAPYTSLNGVYDYYCAYGETYSAYQSGKMPAFFEEGYYEDGTLQNDGAAMGNTVTPKMLRTQEWWTLLAGGAGHIYGNMNIWTFPRDWTDKLNSPGMVQLGHLASFMRGIPWYNLVPDQAHAVATAGYGVPDMGTSNSSCIVTNNYVTTAYFADGTGAVSYAPFSTILTVAMNKFKRPVNAKWFDPTTGTYSDVPGSPFVNSGTRRFVTPNKNGAGDPDWVLLVQETKGPVVGKPKS